MSPMIEILKPGLHTSVQDLGRFGFQNVGAPRSGPLDRVAMRLANALVGNTAGAPVLECLLQGPAFEIRAESVRLAFMGAEAALLVEENGETRRAPCGQSLRLTRGARVAVGALTGSACGYLAFEGGVAAPLALGSAATYTRAALGGIEGRTLRAGDLVQGRRDAVESRPELETALRLTAAPDEPVRVTLGPQDDYFHPESIALFLSAAWTFSAQSDRMGARLEGPPLKHLAGWDIVSDGIVSGSIQVPGNGLPIALLVDNQTAGGYPKIATIISADLPLMGRRRPGDKVRFQAVSRAEAEAARRMQEQAILRAILELRPARAGAGIDIDALYRANLVDGVVSARD